MLENKLDRKLNLKRNKVFLIAALVLVIVSVAIFVIIHIISIHASVLGNLEGYWTLNDGSGSIATDSSGNGYNGNLVGSPAWVAAKFSDGLQFNGSNLVSTSAPWSSSGTISLWVDPTSYSGYASPAGWKIINVTTGGYVLIDEGGSGGTGNWRGVFNPNASSSETDVVDPNPIVQNQWTYLAFTWSSSGTTYTTNLYVNGVLQGTGTWTGTPGSTGMGGFTIGDSGTTSDSNPFYGSIDEVKLYSRALSQTEITELNTVSGNGVPHTTATWTGSSSTSWTNPSNWNINAVPDPYTNIVIGSGNYQPVLTTSITMSGLTINSGSSLNANGENMTINDSGTFTNNGTLILTGSEVLSGITNDTSSGTIMYDNSNNLLGLNMGNSYNNLIFNSGPGLVGYWPMDSTTGSTILDNSGYNYNGVSQGTTYSSFTPPVHFSDQGSQYFNGSSYINVSPYPTNINNLTISAWVNPTSLNQAGYGSVGGTIVESDTDGGGQGYILGIKSNGQIWWWPQANKDLFSTNTVPLNTWSNVALTYNGSTGVVDMYINGVLSNSFSGASSPQIPTFFDIGSKSWTTGAWDGYMGEVRIYNQVLSASEISAIGTGYEPQINTTNTTLNNNLNVNGNLVLNNGALDVSSNNYTVSLSGNLYNNGGVFNAENGNFLLNGSNQSINSSNTFYDLTKTANTSNTLTFGMGSTTIVNGLLTLSGASSNLLSLVSSAPGLQWNINPTGVKNLDYLSVKDGNNLSSLTMNPSNSEDLGDNTNWFNTISGTVFTTNGVSTISNQTVDILVNGVNEGTTTTNSNGIFNFTNITYSGNALITVFLYNDSYNGATIYKSSNATSSITNLNIIDNNLNIGENSSSAITLSDIYTANGGELSYFFNTSLSELNILNGAGLTINNNTVLNLTNSSYTSGNLVIDGTINMNENTMYLDSNNINQSLYINGNLNGSLGLISSGGAYINLETNINLGSNYNLLINGNNTVDCNGNSINTGTLSLENNTTLNCQTSSINLSGNLNIIGSDAYFGNQNLSIGGNITNSGISLLQFPSTNTNLTGNITDSGNLTIDPNNGTLILIGSAQTISGNNFTFYNLEKTSSTGVSSLFIGGGDSLTINGSLTLSGNTTNKLDLNSTNNTQESIIMSGSNSNLLSIDNLNIANSILQTNNSSVILPINPANSTNEGNNLGWFTIPNIPNNLEINNVLNKDYLNNTNPTFSFNMSNPNNNNLQYEIQISNNSTFMSPVVDYTSEFNKGGIQDFTIGEPGGSGIYNAGYTGQTLSNGEYYWRVRTEEGSNSYSNFTSNNNYFIVDTTPPTIPGTPSSASPTVSNTPTWIWTPSTDTVGLSQSNPYTVEWSQNPNFSNNVSSSTSNTNSFTQQLPLSVGTWYFRVKATDSIGNTSNYSQTGSIIIEIVSNNKISITNNSTPTIYPTNISPNYKKISNAQSIIKKSIILNDFKSYGSSKGKIINLKKLQIVHFYVGKIFHSATIDTVGGDFVIITLRSVPHNVKIYTGDTGYYTLKGNSKPSIAIKLIGTNDGIAKLSFRTLNDKIKKKSTKKTHSNNNNIIILFIIILIILLMGIYIETQYQKSKKQ